MVDLHIHTCYSDGTDTSEELIKKLKTKSISVFSVTDHDTVDFYDNTDYGSLDGLRLITGVEFSCRTEVRKCHILGYGFDTNNKCIRELILKGQELRKSKLIKRLEYLEKECGIVFEQSDKDYLLAMKAAGKPHIAQLVVKMGLAETIGEAIEKYMKKLPGGNDKLDAKEAISAIKAAGGIPVWAHPLGGEGEKHLSKEEFENQFGLLKGFGIQGLECFYSRYNKEEIDFLCGVADSNGLCKSAGSDYHGSVKNIEVGTLSCEVFDIDEKMISLLCRLQIDINEDY